jgi:hypothetical protein
MVIIGGVGMAGGVALTFFVNRGLSKLSKKDCSDCEPVNVIKKEVKTVKKIILKIATHQGIDVKEYEELV